MDMQFIITYNSSCSWIDTPLGIRINNMSDPFNLDETNKIIEYLQNNLIVEKLGLRILLIDGTYFQLKKTLTNLLSDNKYDWKIIETNKKEKLKQYFELTNS